MIRAVELFSCSGGMASGFARAGIQFAFAFDADADACDSYEKNVGHRPIRMDVRDLVRMFVAGWCPPWPIDLVVADPPCTPWSRAGKRRGTSDPKDMLLPTIHLIRLLRPRAYLIGNVPGLDDSTNWGVVQEALAPLSRDGYCVADFAQIDAADLGVPQHRVRPFWFGHRGGPCLVWPERTHCDSAELHTMTIPGVASLRSWVTCREALGHLPIEELGRPVRVRHRGGCPTHGSHEGVLPGLIEAETPRSRRQSKNGRKPRASELDAPSMVVVAHGGGNDLVLGSPALARGCITVRPEDHAMSRPDAPARTITRNGEHSDGAVLLMVPHHPFSEADEPSRTVRASTAGTPDRVLLLNPKHPICSPDAPSMTVDTKAGARGAQGATAIEWPWDRPATTVCADDRIPGPGHHLSESYMSGEGAVLLSERARKILQGLPEDWVLSGITKKARNSQLGQLMPPAMAEAVARQIVRWFERTRSGRVESGHAEAI